MGFTAALDGLPDALRRIETVGKRDAQVASMRTLNRMAFGVREAWSDEAKRVFDRPAPLTQRAVLYRRATLGRLEAEIFLRDEAFKGTPPAKYLEPQVRGGGRRLKRFERALQAAGVMPPGTYAMPGAGVTLNTYGNVSAGQVTRILSALRANPDPLSNTKRQKKGGKRGWGGARSGGIFAVRDRGQDRRTAHLQPGVYERYRDGIFATVEPLLVFTRAPRYAVRYDVFALAQRYLDANLARTYSDELSRAIRESLDYQSRR